MAVVMLGPTVSRRGRRKKSVFTGLSGIRVKPARVIASLVVVGLAIWVGLASFASVVRKTDPDRAGTLVPYDANSLALRSRGALTAGSLREARALATAALKRDATAVDAVQTMGISAQASGNMPEAGRWLNYAEHLSRRALPTHLWGIEYHVARNDTAQVLKHYDLALRTSAQARDTLYPLLGAALEDPEIVKGLLERLAKRPLWSADFLSYLASDGSVSPVSAAKFLTVAKRIGLNAPPSSLGVLILRSWQTRQPVAAWQAYLLEHPGADRRKVRNPNFGEVPSDATLFDWVLTDTGSIFAQIVGVSDNRNRLNVVASAGAAGLVAQQVQFLPSAEYIVRIGVDETALFDGSLYWSMQCDTGMDLGKVAVQSSEAHSLLEMDVKVPHQGCMTQLLQLNAYSGDSPEGMRALFSSVSIEQVK